MSSPKQRAQTSQSHLNTPHRTLHGGRAARRTPAGLHAGRAARRTPAVPHAGWAARWPRSPFPTPDGGVVGPHVRGRGAGSPTPGRRTRTADAERQGGRPGRRRRGPAPTPERRRRGRVGRAPGRLPWSPDAWARRARATPAALVAGCVASFPSPDGGVVGARRSCLQLAARQGRRGSSAALGLLCLETIGAISTWSGGFTIIPL